MNKTNLTFQGLPVFLNRDIGGHMLCCEAWKQTPKKEDIERMYHSGEVVPCSVHSDLEVISNRIAANQRHAQSFKITKLIVGHDVAEFLAAHQDPPITLEIIE